MSTYDLMSSTPSHYIGELVYNRGVAMSSTGKYIAVCRPGNGIYVSSDYGINLQLIIENGSSWYSIAMSSSGQYMAVCILNSGGTYVGICVSSNYGMNWTQTNNIAASWYSIAVSSSGQYMAACINNNSGSIVGIYVSSNYGVTWIQSNNIAALWSCIAMSSSGQYMAACISNTINSGSSLNTGIYITSNYGLTWTRNNVYQALWSSIAMSSSGQYMTACVSGSVNTSGIHISSNYGLTWGRSSAFTAYWSSISMSSSGQYITACINTSDSTYKNTGIYLNYQYNAGGTSWYKLINSDNFNSIAISSSGQKISTYSNSDFTLYGYNLYNITSVSLPITPYFGILRKYHFSLNTSNYINIIDPRTLGVGGTGNIYIFNVTSGYSTYLLFRSIYNSTDITQNQIYILNDPTLFHDTNIAIYFSYIYGTVTITNNINCNFIVTVEGSFNYNLPESLYSPGSTPVPGTSVQINFQ